MFVCLVQTFGYCLIKTFSLNHCMTSKYKELILQVLSKQEIMSTNEVLKKLEEKSKKTINWHLLYRVLMDLYNEDKVERLKAKAGFFWKKR